MRKMLIAVLVLLACGVMTGTALAEYGGIDPTRTSLSSTSTN
ncbi:MAG: hypothetical protein ACOY94_25045 [Bacillota bacterium]